MSEHLQNTEAIARALVADNWMGCELFLYLASKETESLQVEASGKIIDPNGVLEKPTTKDRKAKSTLIDASVEQVQRVAEMLIEADVLTISQESMLILTDNGRNLYSVLSSILEKPRARRSKKKA